MHYFSSLSNLRESCKQLYFLVNGLNPGVSVVRVAWSSGWGTLSQWLWRWRPLRLSKRQSLSPTVLFRTTLTRTITLHELIVFLLMIWYKNGIKWLKSFSCFAPKINGLLGWCTLQQALVSDGPDVMGRLSNHWVLGMTSNSNKTGPLFGEMGKRKNKKETFPFFGKKHILKTIWRNYLKEN